MLSKTFPVAKFAVRNSIELEYIFVPDGSKFLPMRTRMSLKAVFKTEAFLQKRKHWPLRLARALGTYVYEEKFARLRRSNKGTLS